MDPHAVVTDALRTVLTPPTAEVAAVARTASEGRRAVAACQPALVVIETAAAGCGAGFVAELRSSDPDVCLVALTACDDAAFCIALLEAGLDAFVLKRSPLRRIGYAIDRALGGDLYLDDGLAPSALALVLEGPGREGPSPPEAEVFAFLGDGLTVAEIASALGLSEEAVATRIEALRERFGFETDARLVRAAVRQRAGLER
ncbi:response regulator transcription factor [Rubrivirga sp. S365]|uniref:response regulator transcription factor n=1 Tax=Rubrivirga sp. S365 TaxID=3076080 RepID=UPI0028C61500|nr:response regulator transcription factor [Rubrivirga sp. S365]MDT7858363.1 response regulator transcription factor [Rubrivirga sp. S365]